MESLPPSISLFHPTKHERQIERDYQITLTASNVDQLKQIEAANLAVTAQAARANLAAQKANQALSRSNLAALENIRDEHRETNVMLGNILDVLEDMSAELANIHNAIDRQTAMQRAAFRIVHADLTRIAESVLETHKTLKNIEVLLRQPYETKVLELRNQASRWLERGMNNSERQKEQADDYEDAFRLLEEVIKNPVGNQDYVAWFQIGWLRWKHYNDKPSAEQAFYRATRLSAPTTDAYHVKSLRHWAQMQYEQQKYEDAYQTIQRAVAISREHDVLRDAARYASRTGRNQEAIQLLDECIELRPTTIVEMFAEEDFH